jgi:hypothetical protein
MYALRKGTLVVAASLILIMLAGHASHGAVASFKKTVTPMEDGRFLIRLSVRASGKSIYGLRLIDPNASIIDVFAPKGWCAVTDGEDYLARTSTKPIKAGGSLEFIIHSTTDEVSYTWAVYGTLKQLGKPGTL